ncbi:hypothetical protein L6164_002288 [Bauhinia variegata]|uniref:Uncharacterized protein n=2 Tax=Bauhinia variegata TaxID=167791 RepID=A0ACB9PZJ9_BAUVA|nr:hypothetical protein L6164_002284 [Bauhinia variegata]KAI4353329.1 hypothetical protein L6164_002288 [Bauhinia variegata]
MACYQYYFFRFNSFWRGTTRFERNLSSARRNCYYNLKRPELIHPSFRLALKGYCSASSNVSSDSPGLVHAVPHSDIIFSSESRFGPAQVVRLGSINNGQRVAKTDPLDGRVMIIDGTSIIYRAYYKLLGM